MDMGDTSGIAATAAWALVLTTLGAVLGLGVGMIIRHSSAAVSTALVWTFVIENLVRSMAPANALPLPALQRRQRAAEHPLGRRHPATLAAPLSRPHDALLFVGVHRGGAGHRHRAAVPP